MLIGSERFSGLSAPCGLSRTARQGQNRGSCGEERLAGKDYRNPCLGHSLLQKPAKPQTSVELIFMQLALAPCGDSFRTSTA